MGVRALVNSQVHLPPVPKGGTGRAPDSTASVSFTPDTSDSESEPWVTTANDDVYKGRYHHVIGQSKDSPWAFTFVGGQTRAASILGECILRVVGENQLPGINFKAISSANTTISGLGWRTEGTGYPCQLFNLHKYDPECPYGRRENCSGSRSFLRRSSYQ